MNSQGEYKFNNRVNMKSNSLREHYEMPRRLDWNILEKLMISSLKTMNN